MVMRRMSCSTGRKSMRCGGGVGGARTHGKNLAAWTHWVRVAGKSIDEIQLVVPPECRLIVAAADEREELYAAARWIRKFLGEHRTARIAVIVPGLEKQRAKIDRVFREVLAPELEDIAAR